MNMPSSSKSVEFEKDDGDDCDDEDNEDGSEADEVVANWDSVDWDEKCKIAALRHESSWWEQNRVESHKKHLKDTVIEVSESDNDFDWR